jgi:hypothetical protein
MVRADPSRLDHKRSEQVRGFIQYVTQTYSGMTPYIINFHLTIDGWQDNRTDSGWKRKETPSRSNTSCGDRGLSEELLPLATTVHKTAAGLGLSYRGLDPPKFVKAAPRFMSDILALRALMAQKKNPLKRARFSKIAMAVYSFVDASGRGFLARLFKWERVCTSNTVSGPTESWKLCLQTGENWPI